MHRRQLLALAGATTTLAIAGCAGDDDNGRSRNGDDNETDDDSGSDDPNGENPNGNETENGEDDGTENGGENGEDNGEEQNSEENPEPELTTLLDIADVDDRFDPGAVTLEGSGQSVTDEFELGGALTVAIFEHDGEANFQPELLDEDGETVEFVANEIGAVEGTAAFPVENGTYFFDVGADGDWSIELAQPFAPDDALQLPPAEAEGEGQAVVGPLDLDGLATVAGEHDGESNFQVQLWSEDATSILDGEVVFNEIGEFEGETSVSYEGVVWIDVNADGAWSLSIE